MNSARRVVRQIRFGERALGRIEGKAGRKMPIQSVASSAPISGTSYQYLDRENISCGAGPLGLLGYLRRNYFSPAEANGAAVPCPAGDGVTGAPEAMGYCHCSSCRSWSAGPVNAFTLWQADAVKVKSGAEHVGTFEKIMCQLPDWATGFPVKAEGWRAKLSYW